jgi:hypothetical protein
MEIDWDAMSRKAYCDAIVKADRERSALDPDSEGYRVLSKAIETFQQRFADLRSKEPRWKHGGRGWEAT